MSEEWDPAQHEDRYRKRLQKIVRDKKKGKTIEIPQDAESEPSAPPDLMAVLKEALAAATK
jgi:DNA end-binding protein Ku